MVVQRIWRLRENCEIPGGVGLGSAVSGGTQAEFKCPCLSLQGPLPAGAPLCSGNRRRVLKENPKAQEPSALSLGSVKIKKISTDQLC